ncbi:MAG TPA: hypothetical protein VGN37_21010 [Actinocatenispora sp.]
MRARIRLRRLCTVVVAVTATAAALAGTSPANGAPPGGTPYVGTQYDYGRTTPLSGPQPDVDGLGRQISASTDTMLADLARQRARLPYSADDYAVTAGRPQVVTYPRPDVEPASTLYATTVSQAGRSYDPVTYTRAVRRPGNRELDTSWSSFSFRGPIVVSVRARHRTDATGCLVRPASAGVRTWYHGGTCTLALTRPANLSVEFTPQDGPVVTHPMLLFANPLERAAPSPGDENVLYFGPGVHHIGANVPLHSNETVYLAGGAWVEGTFVGVDVRNVVIKGRGVLDGLFLDTGNQAENKKQPGLIDIRCDNQGDPARTCATNPTSSNVLVDGLTLVDGPRLNVRALSSYTTVRNVKMIGWWINTDGIVAGDRSLVEHNFVKVNEDSLKLFWGDGVVRDNVVWQLENGAPFMLSWNIEQDSADFHVHDDDVIHVEQYNAPTQGVFDARHAGAGHLQRYLFERIHIEDATYRLFYLNVEHNTWYDPTLGYGSFSELVFRDITAPPASAFTLPSVVNGIDADHGFRNVDLVDLRMGDSCLTTADQANLQLDPDATSQIRVLAGPDCGGHR